MWFFLCACELSDTRSLFQQSWAPLLTEPQLDCKCLSFRTGARPSPCWIFRTLLGMDVSLWTCPAVVSLTSGFCDSWRLQVTHNTQGVSVKDWLLPRAQPLGEGQHQAVSTPWDCLPPPLCHPSTDREVGRAHWPGTPNSPWSTNSGSASAAPEVQN